MLISAKIGLSQWRCMFIVLTWCSSRVRLGGIESLNLTGHPPTIEDKNDPLLTSLKEELEIQGPCWTAAVARINVTPRVEPEAKQRLALDFTNCFLEGAGVKGYTCLRTKLLTNCEGFHWMLRGPHKHVFSVFFMQSQLLLTYIHDKAQMLELKKQIDVRGQSSIELSKKLASAQDLLLESLKSEGETVELKRLATKSHEELHADLKGARRILAELVDTVTLHKLVSASAAGAVALLIGVLLFAPRLF